MTSPRSIRPRRRHHGRSVLRSGKVTAGLVIVAVFVVAAVVGPMLAPYSPSALSAAVLQPPSWSHLLGTTQTGQDVLSQLLVGTRSSLLVGFLAGGCATVLAIAIGLTSGYLGGLSDELLSTLSNVFIVIPGLPLLIVLAGYLKGGSDLVIALVIAATSWAFGARILRAQTLSFRSRDFVLAARNSGESTFRIIVTEILPNELGIIASGLLFSVIFAILTQSSLAFLGLGDPSSWSWGTMLYWAQNNEALTVGAWWWFIPPGLCIALFGAGLALCNFGIDEFINPRLRTGRAVAR
jgi:peptide/nickel transport system permease protein